METACFAPASLPQHGRSGFNWPSVLLASLAMALPVTGSAESSTYIDSAHDACLESFIWQLADHEQRHRHAGDQPLPPQSLFSTSTAHEDCVEFLIEQLADFEERHQLKHGKPPSEPLPEEPAARDWHAFTDNGSTAADASRLYLFAGSGQNAQALPGDLWYYRVAGVEWILAPTGTSKPGRRQHVGFSCGAGQCVTSNGSNLGVFKETWTYAEATGSWSQVNCARTLCPSARQMPSMAYDSARANHLLFGGLNVTSFDDTYTFAAGRWTARNPATRPAARNRAAATFVAGPVNRVVLLGGQRFKTEVLCDMYTWSGTNWQQVTMAGAGPCLHSHSMAWNGSRLMVTGGYTDTSDTPNQDAWYFTFSSATSGAWSKNIDLGFANCAADADPGARMAYDRPSGRKVFFGGATSSDPASRSDKLVICN